MMTFEATNSTTEPGSFGFGDAVTWATETVYGFIPPNMQNAVNQRIQDVKEGSVEVGILAGAGIATVGLGLYSARNLIRVVFSFDGPIDRVNSLMKGVLQGGLAFGIGYAVRARATDHMNAFYLYLSPKASI